MTGATALTCYRSDGWIGIIGNGRWLLTAASWDDPIVERSWMLIRDGAELHQLVAMFTARTDIAYALVGTGDVTRIVVRGPVRADIATAVEVATFAGAPDGQWAGHVITEPVVSVTLTGAGATPGPPFHAMPPQPAATVLRPAVTLLQPPPERVEPVADAQPEPASAPPAADAGPDQVEAGAEPPVDAAQVSEPDADASSEPVDDVLVVSDAPTDIAPALDSFGWASQPTSIVPLIPASTDAPIGAPVSPGTPWFDAPMTETPFRAPVLDRTRMPRPEIEEEPAPTSGAPAIWETPPKAVHELRPAAAGLIADVSWAELLADPDSASTSAPHASSRPIEDMSWTIAPSSPAPERDQQPTPPPASQPEPHIAPQSAAPAQSAAPPENAAPKRDPFTGTTAPLADLDITIWRPIAETSVMHGNLTVAAIRCVDGHLNPLTATSCRICAKTVPPQPSQLVPRPPLGLLRMSTSDTIRLDYGVIFGRDPGTPDPSRRDQPYFVMLADKDISRRHLEVALDGWDVVAIDLQSSNGSAVTMPGGLPEIIPPGERCLLVPGAIVHLSDTISFVFEVTP